MAARTRRSLQRRASKNQNMKYLIILVLVIIFLATIGVKLAINTSLFIAGLSDNSFESVNESGSREILVAPELYNVPDATNSARLSLEGRGTKDTTLTVFLNDEEVEKIDMDSEEFDVDITLEKGENILYLQTEDEKQKRVKDSSVYTIILDTEKPELDITSPADGDTVYTQEVRIEGTTSENTTVKINNLPTVVSSDGTFRRNIRLQEGDNTITITAENSAGNEESIELKVRYERDE